MELSHISELAYNELRCEQFDYFIAVCGYQPRCYFLASKPGLKATTKFLLRIDEQDNCSDRNRHMDFFETNGFKSYTGAVTESTAIEKLAGEICNKKLDNLNILIDYSCMPKKWYSVIMDNITRNNFHSKKINLFLSYTPKIFEQTKKISNTEYFGPIIDDKDNLLRKKPVTIIAGLDNNAKLLHEAITRIKPHNIMAFVPESCSDPDYTASVAENNKSLLEKLNSKQVFRYDMNHPDAINSLLTSCCLDHRINQEVMIIPQGPKVFSMMALLLSVRYPDIKLWEIIGKNGAHAQGQGLPASDPVIIKASFLDDENEEEDPD
jgi:hypothetical protein